MKTNFFTLIITSLVLLLSNNISAQNDFQGEAIYESKTTMDMNFGGREMSEERKKQIAERMKGMLEKTYKLSFNKLESIYKEEEKLESPGSGFGGFGRMMMGSFTAGAQYKNVKNHQLLQDQEFFGKQFLIKDSLPKLDWKLESETKQIGKYLCFKATAIKKVDEFDWRNMRSRRGRNQNNKEKDSVQKPRDSTKVKSLSENIEIPKDVVVTAWYTMQIPVNQGPGEFWGLPGLILEVSSGKTTILCSKITINPNEKDEIKAPSKGKEVTKEEYNTIVKKKVEEMREMRGGRDRGQGSRGRR